MKQSIRCEEVIISNIATRGRGIQNDPIREITQVFTKDGTLIAEYDPTPVKLFDEASWNDAIALAKKVINGSDSIPNEIKDALNGTLDRQMVHVKTAKCSTVQ